jgi:glycosyltransferase involved in cell wall biosynthesis
VYYAKKQFKIFVNYKNFIVLIQKEKEGSKMSIKILVFGCSARAKKLEEICCNIPEVSILGYTDNDRSKWGTNYLGRKVYSLDEFFEIYDQDKDIQILVAPLRFGTIIDQLKEIGKSRLFISLYEILKKGKLEDKYKTLFLNSGTYELEDEERNKDRILLISNNGLPKIDALYRQGFVFRRLIEYRKRGIDIDAYGYIDSPYFEEYEFDNEKIFEGGENGLAYLLSVRQYKKVLIHFPTKEIMKVLKMYVDEGIELICWLHGYEVLRWNRRIFNYSRSEIKENLQRLEKESEEKKFFFMELFSRRNTTIVFVSDWLKNVTKVDVGILPESYQIIPNFIDAELFQYCEKKPGDVRKVLLIKSNKSRVYANDIASKVIMKLSESPIFEKIEFNIYGDGRLFDGNYQELIDKDFHNVHIHKKFLTQKEIAEKHREHGIFLSPTRQDTQGVSMCEAMSSGLVVVTNRVAAIPEYINEDCGVLCDDEDVVQMADAIEWLVMNEGNFIEYSHNASFFMRNRCGLSNTVLKELALINK